MVLRRSWTLLALGAVLLSLAAPASGAEPVDPDAFEVDPFADPTFGAPGIDAVGEIIFEHGWGFAVPPAVDEDLLRSLFVEVALLVELGALDSVDSHLAEVHAAYGQLPEIGRAGLVAVLAEADAELADASSEFRSYLPPGASGVELVSLSGETLSALTGGESGIVPAAPYRRALSLVLSFGATDQLKAAGLAGEEWAELPFALDALARTRDIESLMVTPISALGPAEPTRSDRVEAAGVPGPIEEPQLSRTRWLWAAAVAPGIAILSMIGFVFRRRRSDGSNAVDHRQILFADALRRLTSAEDEAEVARIAVDEGRRMVGATVGLLLRPQGDGLRPAGSTLVLHGSRTELSIATGQTVIDRITDDPIAPGETIELVAVPVVAAGQVNGVLALWRATGESFTGEDRAELATLVPNVAAALKNVDRLSLATDMAMIDGLTALGNRRLLDQDLDDALAANMTVAFAMIDVDHFKLYNDSHGHSAGDEALRIVAQVLADSVRSGDVVYRYGGEEFSILLPGASAGEAVEVAERVRRAVEAAPIPGERSQPGGSVTVSVGVATNTGVTSSRIKEVADQALYGAKEQGRNRVVVA